MLDDKSVLDLLLAIGWQREFPGQHFQFGVVSWLWLDLQDLNFDTLVLRYWQVILDDDFPGCGGVVVDCNEIGIGATSQIILQQVAFIYCTLARLTLDLDRVIDA